MSPTVGLTEVVADEIRRYRHEMRLAGRWGACYEVACFLEHRFHWRRRDGVYQLEDGTPVFKHAWNETDDGLIIDGTADQFFQGGDIDQIGPGEPARCHYRDIYTIAHNPGVTIWISDQAWIGEADDAYWSRRFNAKTLGPGWWLEDEANRQAYGEWLRQGAGQYPLFQAKLEEYRSLGYAI